MKKTYLTPTADVLRLDYADPVCNTVSGTGEVPDYNYEFLDPSDLFESIL